MDRALSELVNQAKQINCKNLIIFTDEMNSLNNDTKKSINGKFENILFVDILNSIQLKLTVDNICQLNIEDHLTNDNLQNELKIEQNKEILGNDLKQTKKMHKIKV